MNLFEIGGAAEQPIPYRLVDIHGLPPGDEYEACLHQLVGQVARTTRAPVALLGHGSQHQLALPADISLPDGEVQLSPHVAQLSLSDRSNLLSPEDQSDEARAIRADFVAYALRTVLMREPGLWGRGQRWSEKHPAGGPHSAEVDVYPSFSWSIETLDDGRLFLAVALSSRYVARRWLNTYLRAGNEAEYRGRRCLYHYGENWFEIEFAGLSGLSIAEQRFVPEGVSTAVDVLAYTREHSGAKAGSRVRELDPNDPAIVFRYPNKPKQLYGALGLCKQIISTDDASAAGLHRRSIMRPKERMDRTRDVVRQHFQGARLQRSALTVDDTPLSIERTVFAVPTQRFGQGKVLAVGHQTAVEQERVIVPLTQFGVERLRMLTSPQAGPLDRTPFGPQYMILPLSCARDINEEFLRRFERAMRVVSGNDDYTISPVYYDDRDAHNLYRQVEAIRQAVTQASIGHGHALLLLAAHAHKRLHNQIKQTFWPKLQIQCATVQGLARYFRTDETRGRSLVRSERAREFDSYVRNCALAMMVVNRKWLWALQAPLHYDIYIGVDVLNGMAGFTFVYNHGQDVYFYNCPSKQQERLTATQMRDVLLTRLREDLRRLDLCPRSVVIHRDGKSFASEIRGLHAAIDQLMNEACLPPDCTVGVVDIRKETASGLRLFEGNDVMSVSSPTVGSSFVLDERRGVVCTTGAPYRFPGTANPLTAVIREGDLNIEFVLEDIFALSQLAFTAPDKCVRLPLTIKLADDLLRPIAATVDEHEATYDVDDLDD